jgi:hypothetical protein
LFTAYGTHWSDDGDGGIAPVVGVFDARNSAARRSAELPHANVSP